MTGPQPGVGAPIIQPPYLRPDPIHEGPGLAPGTGIQQGLEGIAQLLMAKKQQGVQNQMEQQRIDIAQQQQQALGDLRNVETQRYGQEVQDKKDAQAAADLATQTWNGIVNSGQQDDPAAVAKASAKLSNARALAAFNVLHSDYLDGIGRTADASEKRARAQVLLQQAEFDKQIAPVLSNLITNPTKLNDLKNPTVAQAMALKQAGVLDFILDQIKRDHEKAGENAQRDMLGRQMVIDSYKAAQTDWGNWAVTHPQEPKPASFGALWQQYLTPLGLDTTSASAIVSDAAKNLQKRRTDPKFADLPIGAPASLQPFIANSVFQKADSVTRSHLLEAASSAARGVPLAPGIDPNTSRWIQGAAKAIQDSIAALRKGNPAAGAVAKPATTIPIR